MDILEADITVHAYEQRIAARPGNDGILPATTKTHIRGALLNFALYADLEITPIAFKTLIDFKKAYPNDTTIEETLQQFASEPPIKASANRGTIILGLFRANFAPLQLHINTHFPPTEENCTEEPSYKYSTPKARKRKTC